MWMEFELDKILSLGIIFLKLGPSEIAIGNAEGCTMRNFIVFIIYLL